MTCTFVRIFGLETTGRISSEFGMNYVMFTLEQATNAPQGNRGIAPFFL